MSLRERLLTWWFGVQLRPVILTLQVGDTLVLEVDERTSPEVLERISNGVKHHMPEGVKALVFQGVRLAAVLRKGEVRVVSSLEFGAALVGQDR